MLTLTALLSEQYKIQGWKNGTGETREIARDEEEPFRWRVSLAQLNPKNEFSRYPGYDRWIAFLGESPVRVLHDETKREKVVGPIEPYRFSGDIATSAMTSSPMQDFNLIFQRGAAKASLYTMTFRKGEEIQFPLNGQEHFLFCALGSIALEDRNQKQEISLSPLHTARISRKGTKEYLALRAKGIDDKNTVLWATIHLTK